MIASETSRPALDLLVLLSSGKRIAAARSILGLTQSQLAKRIDSSRGTIAVWESKDRVPEGDVLLRLAKALNVNAEWLMMMSDDPTRPESVSPDELVALCDAAGGLPLLTLTVAVRYSAAHEIRGRHRILRRVDYTRCAAARRLPGHDPSLEGERHPARATGVHPVEDWGIVAR